MAITTRPQVFAHSRELVQALRDKRRPLSEAFASALALMPRWKALMDVERAHWDEFLQTQFFSFVDYLAYYFETGDATYKQLFLGEKIKSLYDADAADEQRHTQITAVDQAERRALEEVLRPGLPDAAWQAFAEELDSVHRLLGAQGTKTQRVLLVGDCIFLDIIPFIVGELLASGIKLVPDYATSKNPLELRDQLRKLSTRKFDLVFVSPFSYDFVPEYSALLQWRNALAGRPSVQAVVDKTWDETRTTLDLLADLFDCPIHVHNSAAVVREEDAIKRQLKMKLTERVRRSARQQINQRLAAYVEQKNAQSFKHLFIVDEDRIAQEFGELRAGAYYHRTALQHPAVFGRMLAQRYVDVVFVNAHLVKKKVVVSDLDNTLWEGVIGEGAVTHHHDRQQALKALKGKGVVLAINSKNDPANVHWRGGTLSDGDFVHAAISWDPKVQAMKRIQSDLNLKYKDFVFVDDREDELELMRMTYPELVCLDATDRRTWERFGLWKDFLDDDLEMDRTLMYQQREQRKAFVRDDVSSDEEKAALFAALQLKVKITPAQSGDLKRVAELVNRTNQFNLEGSRTSFKEVCEWHASGDHLILTAQTSDRFGDMGTTCVAVARIAGDEMHLLPFVLSCRVFGYGIERSVLNQLKRTAAARGAKRLVGRYTPTPQNAPCKDFLADNGFQPDGERWICDVGAALPQDAPWLTVEAVSA